MVHLLSRSEYAQFWGFGGTCVSLTTSCYCGVSFCIAVCVVLTLNSQTIQKEACISIQKSMSIRHVGGSCVNIIFSFISTENKVKWKRTAAVLIRASLCSGAGQESYSLHKEPIGGISSPPTPLPPSSYPHSLLHPCPPPSYSLPS